MAGNLRWTEAENEVIRNAAALSRYAGEGIGGRGRNGRQGAVADALGRSYGAVRNRAVRNAFPRRLHSARAAHQEGVCEERAVPSPAPAQSG